MEGLPHLSLGDLGSLKLVPVYFNFRAGLKPIPFRIAPPAHSGSLPI